MSTTNKKALITFAKGNKKPHAIVYLPTPDIACPAQLN